VTRPVKELRSFARITLQPGERRTVSFTLDADDLAFYDRQMRRIVEPGTFTVWVGTSSADEGQRGRFEVTGEPQVVAP
jgi:beta-glucosidase